ncbi:MAG TPA: AI-2E family transporter [Aestuariivirgaceae bacterium]|nr:AI-2E family transporter [Aestuariivirgaceae bacterium]
MPPTPPSYSPIGDSGPDVGRRWLRADNILLVSALAIFVWFTGDVLLLVFAGLLLAVGFDGLTSVVRKWLPLSQIWALALVLVAIMAFLAVIGMTVVPQFLGQLDDLWDRLFGFAERTQETLRQYDWFNQLMPNGEGQGGAADAASAIAQQAASAMLAAFGIASSLIILLAIAIFAAADPDLYRRGLLTLLPPARRDRMRETLEATAHALRWWFLAQVIAMLALGVTVAVGLLIIGVDLWLSLGVLAGLLTFIPFLGPILAGIPIVIVGFSEGLQTGLIVLVFFLVVQTLEGNFLGPMIQHRVVNLAPVLLISVQVLMSALFGAMGLVMAAPLTLVAMIFVKKLYVEDTLGEPQGSP